VNAESRQIENCRACGIGRVRELGGSTGVAYDVVYGEEVITAAIVGEEQLDERQARSWVDTLHG
jgi:hypothetical protein